jgi:hypothetical protein
MRTSKKIWCACRPRQARLNWRDDLSLLTSENLLRDYSRRDHCATPRWKEIPDLTIRRRVENSWPVSNFCFRRWLSGVVMLLLKCMHAAAMQSSVFVGSIVQLKSGVANIAREGATLE